MWRMYRTRRRTNKYWLHLADVDGCIGIGRVELLQLVEELGEPEPEAIVAELDGEVDDDHDDSHPEKKKTFLGVALKEKF